MSHFSHFDWNYMKSYDNEDYPMLIKYSYSSLQVFDEKRVHDIGLIM